MKKKFWSGLALVIAFLIIFYITKQLILFTVSSWKTLYYSLIPAENLNFFTQLLNLGLLFVFSLICSLLVIFIVGVVFSIRIKEQSLSDILLRYFSRIPGIRFIVKLIHQIVEGSQSFNKKEIRLAIYMSSGGERKLGVIKPRKVILNYTDSNKQELVINFWQGITPYPFSGIPSLVLIKNVYEITNISYEDYLKYLTTGGLFFKLPSQLILRNLADNRKQILKSVE